MHWKYPIYHAITLAQLESFLIHALCLAFKDKEKEKRKNREKKRDRGREKERESTNKNRYGYLIDLTPSTLEVGKV